MKPAYVLFLAVSLFGCGKEEKSVAEMVSADKAKLAAEDAEAKKPKAKLTLRDAAPISRDELRNKIHDGFIARDIPMYADKLETVLDVVGRPDSTQEIGNAKYLYYENLTRDSLSGKVDRQVQLVFHSTYWKSSTTGTTEGGWYLTGISFN